MDADRLAVTVQLLRRLCDEERGQDLIEYALLTGAVGMAAVAAWSAMGDAIASAYSSWDTAVQSLWEPQDPGT